MCYSAQNCHTREARPKEQTKTPTKVHQLQNRQNTITQISPENGKPFWGQMDPIETIKASIRPDKLRVLKYPSPKLFTLRFRPTIGCFTYVLDGFLRSGTKIEHSRENVWPNHNSLRKPLPARPKWWAVSKWTNHETPNHSSPNAKWSKRG